MTETFIRYLAKKHKLNLLKRITTGDELRHFATFELAGDYVQEAVRELRNVADQYQQKNIEMRRSDVTGELYIEIQSVWCDESDTIRVKINALRGTERLSTFITPRAKTPQEAMVEAVKFTAESLDWYSVTYRQLLGKVKEKITIIGYTVDYQGYEWHF
jgi:hypothetical protein